MCLYVPIIIEYFMRGVFWWLSVFFFFLASIVIRLRFNLQMKAVLIPSQTHLFLTALVPVAGSLHTRNRRPASSSD